MLFRMSACIPRLQRSTSCVGSGNVLGVHLEWPKSEAAAGAAVQKSTTRRGAKRPFAEGIFKVSA